MVLVLAQLMAAADEPVGYYTAAEGRSGADLRLALHHIVRGHRVISYSSGVTNTAEALKVLDEDPANTNNVLLIYSRMSQPKSAFGVTGGWNREHVWPNSYGLDSRQPAYSDLHNLHAEDANVNGARQNKYFDVSDTNSANYKFPAYPEAVWCSTDTDSWEPPEAVKGDVARSLFYMAVRYQGGTNGEPALFLTDATTQLNTTTNLMARLTTLLAWHRADPVDAAERRRNDLVYQHYQRNRNPFVDRPEWAETAFLPALALTCHGTNLTVSWPAEYGAALLEQGTGMGDSWLPAAGSRATNGGAVTATFTLSPGEPALRLFRLRLR